DVARMLEVDVVEQLVDERHLVLGRRERLQVRERDRARPVPRRFVERSVAVVVRRRDQVDPHRPLRITMRPGGYASRLVDDVLDRLPATCASISKTDTWPNQDDASAAFVH